MTTPQEIAREKRRQKEVSATELFEKSGLQRKPVGMLWNKKDAWVIPYRSPEQKTAINNLLEQAGVINLRDLVLPEASSGNIIIEAESALGKSLEHRRLEHEAGKHADWFRYEKLTGKDARQAGYYIPYKTKAITHCHHDNYAHIDWSADENYDSTGKADIDLNSGAKFHLSIAERDLPRAWNAIAGHVIRNHINCKVMRPPEDRQPNMSNDAVDKKIVIYIPKSQLQDKEKIQSWKRILAEMDAVLHEQGIIPAGAITSDKAVGGSDYLYYRYGKTEYNDQGKATNRWDDVLVEATGGEDVFADLQITRNTSTTARDRLSAGTQRGGAGKAQGAS